MARRNKVKEYTNAELLELKVRLEAHEKALADKCKSWDGEDANALRSDADSLITTRMVLGKNGPLETATKLAEMLNDRHSVPFIEECGLG